jgi:hypothetical protein
MYTYMYTTMYIMYIMYIIYIYHISQCSQCAIPICPPCPFRLVHLQESHSGPGRLSKIALRLRPELLRYLLDRTITADVIGDDPDTTVTVQSFLCHFDRSSRSCLVAIKNPKKLMDEAWEKGI